MKNKMQWNQWIVTAAILGVCGTASQTRAQETTDTFQSLKQQNELLNQKLKALEEQFNQRIKALEEQLQQKGRVVDRNRELKGEITDAKLKETASRFKIPDWVTSIKLMDDLRARYDGIYAPDADFVTRQRARFRLRLGGIASLQDELEVGFRLASSPSISGDAAGDPLSTNATLENNGSRKPVGVDWAFARWTPIHTPAWTGAFAFGKMENPPNFSENVFDVDYTPEGFAEQFTYKPHTNHTVSAYLGQYFLDELGFSGNDPYLLLEQLRLDSKWSQHINTSLGISGLSITNPKSLTTANVPDSNHGNTRTKDGVLVNDYQVLIVDGGVTYHLDSFPFYKGTFPIKLSGEYLHNFGASSDNFGYAFGPTFGRTGQKGNWEFSYRYQELQGDSNYEELTASDNGAFYRGRPFGEPATLRVPTFLNGINLRGHIFRLMYNPFDSLTLDGRLWLNEAINEVPPGDKVEGIRVLVDAIWRF